MIFRHVGMLQQISSNKKFYACLHVGPPFCGAPVRPHRPHMIEIRLWNILITGPLLQPAQAGSVLGRD